MSWKTSGSDASAACRPDASLSIHNDGAPGADHAPGSGLAGLSDRLERAGGELRWQQHEGWFSVTARVPTGSGRPT